MGEIRGYNPEDEMAKKKTEAERERSSFSPERRGFLGKAAAFLGATALAREVGALERVAGILGNQSDQEPGADADKEPDIETRGKEALTELFDARDEIVSQFNADIDILLSDEMDQCHAHFVKYWQDMDEGKKQALIGLLSKETASKFSSTAHVERNISLGTDIQNVCDLFSSVDAYGAFYASLEEGDLKNAVDTYFHDNRKFKMRAADYLPKSSEIAHEDLDTRLRKDYFTSGKGTEEMVDNELFKDGSPERLFFNELLDREQIRVQFKNSNCTVAEVVSALKAFLYSLMYAKDTVEYYERVGDEIRMKEDPTTGETSAHAADAQQKEIWFGDVVTQVKNYLEDLTILSQVFEAIKNGHLDEKVKYFLEARDAILKRPIFSKEVKSVVIASINNTNFDGTTLHEMAKDLCPNAEITYLVDTAPPLDPSKPEPSGNIQICCVRNCKREEQKMRRL